MNTQEYDVVVIGTGPGGEGAAMQAVKLGQRVAVVERHKKIGGGCTHWGTIPSKALRHAIFKMTDFESDPRFRNANPETLSFPELRETATEVIASQVDMRRTFYERNDVDVHFGHGRFTSENTIEIEDADSDGRLELKFGKAVIATGSTPYRPDDIDFNHPRIFDSDSILKLDRTPRSVTVLGAGVIGCEYGSMFRNLDVKVNLINSREQLLSFLDDEIVDALSYHLRSRGVIIRHRELYESIEGCNDGVILSLKSGKKIKSDILLAAIGRSGNSDDLGLDTIGLETNSRFQLEVNENFQTSIPHIYAVGDIIGFPSLASAAYVQGRYAGMHIVKGEADRAMVESIPTGIYTSPEISSVGKTERQLTEEQVPYEVGMAHFRSLARAQITGRPVGMLKILFHRETLQVLGVHCFGMNASEIIHIGQAILSQKGEANSLHYFMNTTFNYPTMAEAYRVAALNGYNRLF
ncbi:MAG: Si-specific NAD(P)(+) transhydrogenase [Planctomycetaceae bacterium]